MLFEKFLMFCGMIFAIIVVIGFILIRIGGVRRGNKQVYGHSNEKDYRLCLYGGAVVVAVGILFLLSLIFALGYINAGTLIILASFVVLLVCMTIDKLADWYWLHHNLTHGWFDNNMP